MPSHRIYKEVDRAKTMTRQVTIQAKVTLSDMDRDELAMERGHHQHFMSLKAHIRDLEEKLRRTGGIGSCSPRPNARRKYPLDRSTNR